MTPAARRAAPLAGCSLTRSEWREWPVWRTPALCAPVVLSSADARQLAYHHARLQQALEAQDRAALRQAKQAVLQAAYLRGAPTTPALRLALRRLSWWMAALRLPRPGQAR